MSNDSDIHAKTSGLGIGEAGQINEPIELYNPGYVKPTGQLWEECDCGNEPIYMPLHICLNCWPKK